MNKWLKERILSYRGCKYNSLTRLWQCTPSDTLTFYYVHDSVINNISLYSVYKENWHELSNSRIIRMGDAYIAVYGGKFTSYDVLESLLYQTLFPNKKLSEMKFGALELKKK